MELGCIFSYINKLGTISNKFITKRIKEEGLPILQNHALLFFILPEDKSPLLFSEIVDRGKISKKCCKAFFLINYSFAYGQY